MFAFARHTIFLGLAGSHAHGTARETSDVDLRGVCIAPLSRRVSLFETFEQYEGPLDAELTALAGDRLASLQSASAPAAKTECVVFDVAKFLRLCATANPAALEILFTDERDWLYETPAWRRLQQHRRQFLTRKVEQTFVGYALAQLKRIKTHRSWRLSPPSSKPSREAFGLPPAGSALSPDDRHRIEESIAERIRSHGIDTIELPAAARLALQQRLDALLRDVLAAAADDLEERRRDLAIRALRLPSDVVAVLAAEKRYHAAMKQWQAYEDWRSGRNPARAELERRHGFDTKHAMHLVRLLRMGIEVLEHGELRIRRDDAAELIAIRDGALSYEQLLATVDDLQLRLKGAGSRSSLPADVDRADVDRLAVELMLAEPQGTAPRT